MQARDGKPASTQPSRPRRQLRGRLEACLKQLGSGFLRHPANGELRRLVSAASSEVNYSPADAFYRELLALVYQQLILLVCEGRGLRPARLSRLPQLLNAPDRFEERGDLWPKVRALWSHPTSGRESGTEPSSGILLLDASAGNDSRLPSLPLEQCPIHNSDWLEALAHITWHGEDENGPLDYTSLDIEELGSAYESLLELRPVIVDGAGAGPGQEPRLELVAGSQRKHSGSYYTPPELIEELIQSTLKPLVEERLATARRMAQDASQAAAEQAILNIRVCDPACGAGHFLLAAARWLGRELARVRTGSDEPPDHAVRNATADVITRCIYGVDRDPFAVGLCRTALWLEAHASATVSTSLTRHIRCGDALVGVHDLGVLPGRPPHDAALARQNGQPERTRVQSLRQACDLWTAAFFEPRHNDKSTNITTAVAQCLEGKAGDQPWRERVQLLASQQRFFHWLLEFPEVFAGGGFDVVLGNPPWLSYTGRQKVAIMPSYLAFLTTRFPAISRWPCAHAAFLLLARDVLRQGGRCGLVLPRQLADLDSFAPVRKSLATDMRLIGNVRDVGEDAFEGVTQPVALYCFARSGSGESYWPIERHHLDDGRAASIHRAAPALPAPLISLLAWAENQPTFPGRTFSDPGVHTGNVSRKIILIEPCEVPCGRLEPVREGKDITAFHLAPPRKWVWVDPQLADGEYCRIRDGGSYRATPILLRQTANRPIAARHVQPAYFRNSVLACHGLPNIPDRVLVGFLNSSLYAFLHQARFKDPGQRAFPQVKIKHLHSLPCPPLAALAADGDMLMRRLETVVEQIEQAVERGDCPAALTAQLDLLVLRAYGLSEDLVPLLREHVI